MRIKSRDDLGEGVGVGKEGGDVGGGGVPAAHEAVAGGADEVIKMPAVGGQGGGEGIGEAGEDGVGGGLGAEGDAGDGAEAGGELTGHGVGVGGVAEPGAVFEEAHPLGAEETHFGSKLAGLFAAVFELAGESGLEEDDGFGGVHAVFGAAETQDVHPGAPGEVGRGDAVAGGEGGGGVGEAGAIHVDGQAVGVGGGGEGGDLGAVVEGAPLGGLGEGEDAGFGVVEIGAFADKALDGGGGEFAVGAVAEEEFGAVGEKLGGAAFVGFDVGGLVTDDAVVTLAEGGEGEGVGGGAVEDKKDLGGGMVEDVSDEVASAASPVVGTVGGEAALVGGGEGGPSFGANAGGVVAGEAVALHDGGGGHGRGGRVGEGRGERSHT